MNYCCRLLISLEFCCKACAVDVRLCRNTGCKTFMPLFENLSKNYKKYMEKQIYNFFVNTV